MHSVTHNDINDQWAITEYKLSNDHLLQLIVLSDLENDFTNPHDASDSLNKWVVSFQNYVETGL